MNYIRILVRWMLVGLDQLPHSFYNRINQYLLDAACSGLALYLAFQLRFDGHVPAEFQRSMWTWMVGLAAMRAIAIRLTDAHRTVWRYFGLRDCPQFFLSAATPTLFLLAIRLGSESAHWLIPVPGSVLVLDLGLFSFLALGMRTLRRVSSESARRNGHAIRALVLGSAETLATGVYHLSSEERIRIVGILTPERSLHDLCIAGIPVLGSPADLERHISCTGATQILVTDVVLPHLEVVIEQATILGVDVQLLPSAHNILRGEARASRPLKPHDVLFSARTNDAETKNHLPAAFEGKSVLISGAGGSIGSELARQLGALHIKRLVLLERDENSLFEVNRELEEANCAGSVVPIVGDIRDRHHLDQIFSETAPDIVLHAAAFKHVTMMEFNAPEAVLNNVVGTRNLLDVSLASGAKRFVMISTDKAVHPSSIMGASKRVAELLVQSRAAALGAASPTQCACVRFGNVLGSRGSVVPIFISQINRGGPITITDEDMTRYFMTIPEAVHLVLMAATLPSRGHVFMLNMGDPVRIVELAEKLILRAGLQPGRDIKIKFIGSRPGEKLQEQLCLEGSVVLPTELENVFAVQANALPPRFESEVAALEKIARERNHDFVASSLMKLVNAVDAVGAVGSSPERDHEKHEAFSPLRNGVPLV